RAEARHQGAGRDLHALRSALASEKGRGTCASVDGRDLLPVVASPQEFRRVGADDLRRDAQLISKGLKLRLHPTGRLADTLQHLAENGPAGLSLMRRLGEVVERLHDPACSPGPSES